MNFFIVGFFLFLGLLVLGLSYCIWKVFLKVEIIVLC